MLIIYYYFNLIYKMNKKIFPFSLYLFYGIIKTKNKIKINLNINRTKTKRSIII